MSSIIAEPTVVKPTNKQLPADLVAWFEARGYIVDARTGKPTKPAASVNWTVAAQPSKRSRYNAGFDAYCAGATLAEVQHDPQMRRGWFAALDAEAACESGVDVKAGW